MNFDEKESPKWRQKPLCTLHLLCYLFNMKMKDRAMPSSTKEQRRYQYERALNILRGRRDGMTFTELARIHGVSRTRIHQIHTQILLRLRGAASAPEGKRMPPNWIKRLLKLT